MRIEEELLWVKQYSENRATTSFSTHETMKRMPLLLRLHSCCFLIITALQRSREEAKLGTLSNARRKWKVVPFTITFDRTALCSLVVLETILDL